MNNRIILAAGVVAAFACFGAAQAQDAAPKHKVRGSHAMVDNERVRFTTSPGTDLWQRTYYGFRNDNAPALLLLILSMFVEGAPGSNGAGTGVTGENRRSNDVCKAASTPCMVCGRPSAPIGRPRRQRAPRPSGPARRDEEAAPGARPASDADFAPDGAPGDADAPAAGASDAPRNTPTVRPR